MSAARKAKKRDTRPLYARLLRLKHIRPGSVLGFFFLEGTLAVGLLLALAELAPWWIVPVLVLVVAAMVKLNDVIAGAVSGPVAAPVRPVVADQEDDSADELVRYWSETEEDVAENYQDEPESRPEPAANDRAEAEVAAEEEFEAEDDEEAEEYEDATLPTGDAEEDLAPADSEDRADAAPGNLRESGVAPVDAGAAAEPGDTGQLEGPDATNDDASPQDAERVAVDYEPSPHAAGVAVGQPTDAEQGEAATDPVGTDTSADGEAAESEVDAAETAAESPAAPEPATGPDTTREATTGPDAAPDATTAPEAASASDLVDRETLRRR